PHMTEPTRLRIRLAPDPNTSAARQRRQPPGYPGHRHLPLPLNQHHSALATIRQGLLERAPVRACCLGLITHVNSDLLGIRMDRSLSYAGIMRQRYPHYQLPSTIATMPSETQAPDHLSLPTYLTNQQRAIITA